MADATRRVSVRLSLDDAARVKAGLREVGETGQRSLDQIKGGAERASRSLELLDVAVRGIQLAGVAVATRALVQAGDALTQSLSRLQNATGSVERAGQVYEALYRNALSTGVAVAESVDALRGTSDDFLKTPWKLLVKGHVVMESPRYQVIEDTFTHMAHHRGQLTVYLRLCGSKVASVYGPSADDRQFG